MDSDARGKVLLANIISGSSALGLRRWALELQTIVHVSSGNYLNEFFVKLRGFDAGLAGEFAERVGNEGVVVNANSGYFHSLDHLDPNERLPAVDRKLWNDRETRYIDFFTHAHYDLEYRPRRAGHLSRIVQLTYADGVRLDVDINTISDNFDPAPHQAVARAYQGIGDRIFPARWGPSTTPELWKAKHEIALRAMGQYNQEFETFVSIATAGVFTIFDVIGVVSPVPTTSGSRSLATSRSTRGRPPVASRATQERANIRPQSGEPSAVARGTRVEAPSPPQRTRQPREQPGSPTSDQPGPVQRRSTPRSEGRIQGASAARLARIASRNNSTEAILHVLRKEIFWESRSGQLKVYITEAGQLVGSHRSLKAFVRSYKEGGVAVYKGWHSHHIIEVKHLRNLGIRQHFPAYQDLPCVLLPGKAHTDRIGSFLRKADQRVGFNSIELYSEYYTKAYGLVGNYTGIGTGAQIQAELSTVVKRMLGFK